MMMIVDLSFNTTPHISSVNEAHQLFKVSYGYTELIQLRCEVEVILRLGGDEEAMINNVSYRSFKANSSIFRLLRYLRSKSPDVVIVNGLDFFRQTILLRKFLPASSKIVVRHHGERYSGNYKTLRQYADKCVDAYMFTSFGNAREWIENGIIASQAKCFEVLEASTYMQQQDKPEARAMLGIPDTAMFLSVGRLNANKDPLTVIKGFHQYVLQHPTAKLYLIYQTEDLLNEIISFINNNSVLNEAIIMVGKVPNEQLKQWYSAADYFISGSHSEGSGYALIEAMACGCIPVVTDIPSFANITDGGKQGFLFQAGDASSLTDTLSKLDNSATPQLSAEVVAHFKSNLSYQKIANDIYEVCQQLRSK